MIKGAKSVSMIERMTPSMSPPPDCNSERMSKPASKGVMKTPSMLDRDAVQTAAATFPRAIDVNAIDDCTVDGRMVRNRKPIFTLGLISISGRQLTARPSSGKRTNVLVRTRPCSRHAPIPPRMASRDSFAPCMKKRRKIAPFVNHSNPIATSPRHGRILAVTTTPSSTNAYGSGFNHLTQPERGIPFGGFGSDASG